MTTDAVRFHVEPPGARDRWSALFRPILSFSLSEEVGEAVLVRQAS